MATTFLSKTLGTPTDNNKWTFSCWFKRTGFESQTLIYSNDGSTSNVTEVAISDAAKMVFQNKVGGSTTMNLTTNRLFRDTSAFYHVVAVFDSSNSTEADRQIIYINGVRETSFATNNPASLNEVSTINSGNVAKIGKGNTSEYFNGLMTHVHFIDGTAYPASTFGEVDSTSGIWTAKTTPSVTYGTNGFFLKMENASAMGTDSSGESNTFTVSGSLTKNQDTPANNFCTMNPLDNYFAAGTFSNGNNTVITSNGNYARNSSTIGMATGKWYSEYKVGSITGSGGIYIGITGDLATGTGGNTGNSPFSYAYASNGTKHFNGSSSSFGNSYTTGDIIGVALDATNSKIWWSKNGVWQGSGDPSNGSNPAYTVVVPSSTTIGAYFWSFSDNNSGEYFTCDCNFGNGYFGTTPVSSAGTNASGNGIFEYDVPTGYTALSTEGLNS